MRSVLDRDEHHLRTGSLCDVVTRPLTSLRVTVSADCWPLQFSLSVFVWDLLRRYTHNSALLSSTLPNTVLRKRVNKGYKNLQNGGKSSHCLSHFYKRQALVRNIFQYQYDILLRRCRFIFIYIFHNLNQFKLLNVLVRLRKYEKQFFFNVEN